MRTSSHHRLPALVSALGLVLLLAWDSGPGDLLLAHLAGSEQGFALREHWLPATALHGGGRWLSWAVALALCIGVWWPQGSLQQLDAPRRLQLAAGSLAAALCVSTLKSFSAISCPWDLREFGGLAQHLGHWRGFWQTDGGTGHCFPAGHASAGFGFLGGWFAWRTVDPARAQRWLAGALLSGAVLGLGQQWRGAHFMSHTLWSAWLCWNVAWAADALRDALAPRGSAAGPALAGDAA
jgi:membrane-associated PAP2 superfamily phosphatase